MKKWIKVIAIVIIGFLLFCIFAHWKIIQTANETPPSRVPYIIVLGAKVNGEEMSLSLRYRAEAALTYLSNNNRTKVIVTGGQGPDEDITEAEAMRRYFIAEGIDPSRILIEQQSTSTYENLLFSKDLYHVREAVIVSNDFHLYRATKIAENLGIKSHPLAAKTPNVVKVPMYLREYLAILKLYITGK